MFWRGIALGEDNHVDTQVSEEGGRVAHQSSHSPLARDEMQVELLHISEINGGEPCLQPMEQAMLEQWTDPEGGCYSVGGRHCSGSEEAQPAEKTYACKRSSWRTVSHERDVMSLQGRPPSFFQHRVEDMPCSLLTLIPRKDDNIP